MLCSVCAVYMWLYVQCIICGCMHSVYVIVCAVYNIYCGCMCSV